jgi:uncharacterized delta-60 repeat protein
MSRPLSPSALAANCSAQQVRGVLVSILVASLLLYAAPNRVKADDGDLDKSFGAGGKVITDFSGGEDEATAVAIQNDGKIVAVGSTIKPFVATDRDFALARYNPDGSLDTSFGSGGKVATNFGNSDTALAVAIQPDGKIITAGKAFKNGHTAIDTGYYFALARHNSDGSLDTSFGTGGKVTGDLGLADAIAIQGDGKIVAAGVGLTDSEFPTPAFLVARYNIDGSLDTSFGGGGKVTTEFFPGNTLVGGGGNSVRGVVIQADGKIVAAGSAFNPVAMRTNYALARYNSDGSLDKSFGLGGKVVSAILDDSLAIALTIQAPDKIVVAGSAALRNGTGTALAVARYNSDGSLDSSFGSSRKATDDFFGVGSIVRAVAFRADGEIVAAGSVPRGAKGFDIAVARYNSDGTLDKRFGEGGKVITEFSKDEDDDANAVAIQSDGQIVVAGATDTGDEFALARYNTEQDFALAFESSTISVERGTKVRVTLQVARKGGFSGNVTITHSDTSSLNIKGIPDSISTTDNSVSFKLKIKDGAPTGQQQVTFTGKSVSGLERTTTLNLVIH